MFTHYALTALVALVSTQAALAEVTPSEPGPNASYTAGKTCRVTWEADTESTTAWKNMAIQLMSGSNFDMQHVTTVASAQDGTVAGVVEYTCPEVTPYSNIYFYQFTATDADTKAWTTRFTITSPTGETTDPANKVQPNSGDAIPWGVGTLVDPSQAVAPPASAGGSGSTGSSAAASTSSTSATSTATGATGATGSSSAAVAGATTSSSKAISSSASVRSSSTSSATAAAASGTSTTIENGALSNMVNSRVLQVTLLFSATALFL
ncbi:hypothetical protein BDQ17DRAFT_1248158 [Cyathus striatus]|nr:hypothetical protein BDQ17DRAFT_1248158 [Cyathus striatus]